MALYMLDTDISSYIMKRADEAVLRRLQAVAVTDVCISAISKAELLYGIEVSPRRQKDQAALDEFLRYVGVLDFPAEAALDYALIRADIEASRETDWRKRSADCGACPLPRANPGDQSHQGILAGWKSED